MRFKETPPPVPAREDSPEAPENPEEIKRHARIAYERLFGHFFGFPPEEVDPEFFEALSKEKADMLSTGISEKAVDRKLRLRWVSRRRDFFIVVLTGTS